MIKRRLIVPALAAALSLSAGFALAADPEPAKEQAQTQTQKQEEIYGSHLMTPQERADHRAKMHAAKTVEEREKIRKEQHKLMQERAKARGMTLPDEPPAMGSGMGPGGGMGMGPGGGGMGPGGRRGY